MTRIGPDHQGRRLLREWSGAVTIVTGHDEPGTADNVRALGTVAYLLKPLDKSHLLIATETALHSPPPT